MDAVRIAIVYAFHAVNMTRATPILGENIA